MFIVEKQLNCFLKKHYKEKQPLLVGFSGGPDSMALAHALYQQKVLFELAHLDHAYRQESTKESDQLIYWAKSRDIPIHTRRLRSQPSHNLEDFFRNQRHLFFKELYSKKQYQALLLAHHQGDTQETTLKRLLEGALFSQLNSLKEITNLQGMIVWRPLLNISKGDVYDYIEAKRLNPIVDPTNFDGSNLRSAIRTQMIPYLESVMNKNIRNNLSFINSFSEDLGRYLDQQTASIKTYKSPNGILVDFAHSSCHKVELLHFLRSFLRQNQILINRDQIYKSERLISEKSKNKKIHLRQHTLFFNDPYLMIIESCKLERSLPQRLKLGSQIIGPWKITVSETSQKPTFSFDWKEAFLSETGFSFAIPNRAYQVTVGECAYGSTKKSSTTPRIIDAFMPSFYSDHDIYFARNCFKSNSLSESYLNISVVGKKD